MTETEKRRYLDFLQAKVKMLADRMDVGSATGFIQMNSISMESLIRDNARTSTHSKVKAYDRELELMTREELGPKVVNEVVAELKKKFGFGRIAADPDVVIKRVVRRKRIANAEELSIILDVLACVDDYIDPKVREVIDDAARRYEGLDKWGPVKRVDI